MTRGEASLRTAARTLLVEFLAAVKQRHNDPGAQQN
jgi:hypothetical protein